MLSLLSSLSPLFTVEHPDLGIDATHSELGVFISIHIVKAVLADILIGQ